MAEYIEREAEIEIPSMRPIIEQIATQMRLETENGIVKAVQEVGFRVDKERLLKALTEAKTFYEEGYRAARFAADVVEVVRCKDCIWYAPDTDWGIDEATGKRDHSKIVKKPYGECHGQNFTFTEDGFLRVGEDDFCSYGEKRRAE